MKDGWAYRRGAGVKEGGTLALVYPGALQRALAAHLRESPVEWLTGWELAGERGGQGTVSPYFKQ